MKKAAVFNDLSGFGKCSLTAAIPVLSAQGVQCCPMASAPSLRFSTSIFLILPHSKNHPNQHNCWLFYFFKKLDTKIIFLLLSWCYGVIM